MDEIAERLRQIRQSKGISRHELADALGTTPQLLEEMEAGIQPAEDGYIKLWYETLQRMPDKRRRGDSACAVLVLLAIAILAYSAVLAF